MRFYQYPLLLVLIAASLLLPPTVAAQPGTLPQQAAAPNISHALRISSGDLLDVGVFDTPELSGKLRVNEAGEIAMPIAGAVRVSGMTSSEAATAVEQKLHNADILKDPHVSIFVLEYATQGVTVTGEVKTPGIYPLLGSHGLLDMVSAAGGVTATASKAVTITHTSDPGHPEIIQLDNKPGSTAGNVDIRPGDVIVVSRCGVVYVMGDVLKPGGYLIDNNDRLTAAQAVALAGGTNRTASKDKSRLIRKTPNGPEEIPLPLKSILALKATDLPLEDGDILFVPSSEAKNMAYRGIEATIAVAAGVAIAVH